MVMLHESQPVATGTAEVEPVDEATKCAAHAIADRLIETSGRRRKRKHVAVKPPLLTRDVIDGRTSVAKAFDKLVDDIHSDLGGREALSAIELALVEAFVGASVTLDQLNAKLLLGEKIDLSQHSQASNAMVRIASRLGLRRRPRDVTPPDPLQYACEAVG
jgi:hypothetical protein